MSGRKQIGACSPSAPGSAPPSSLGQADFGIKMLSAESVNEGGTTELEAGAHP